MPMAIKVRYFASLRESVGRTGDSIDAAQGMTVRDVWQAANRDAPLPGNVLAAVNMDYAELDARVEDGDEVAFFPPVTGGCR